MTITEFILARVAEDEARAKVAEHDGFERTLRQCAATRRVVATMQTALDQSWQDGEAAPVIEFVATRTLRTLAAIWSDSPDYREEWAQ